MALTVTHPFVSLEPAKTDPAEVGGADWNANHSLSGTLPVLNGGTGATTEADARTNLGLGTIATQNSNNVSISGGSISGISLTSLDSNTTIQDNADPTKQMKFELSGISAGQTRTLTVPDASTTLVGQDTADSLTNKITVDTANLEVSNLKAKDGTAAGTITDVTGIVTLNSAVLTTADINGGTIDGVALGGSAAVSLGTPSSGTLTNCTGLPVSTGIAGLGTGVATFLATPSSANLAAAVTDETGTGALVFGTTPSISTPVLTNPSFSGATANMGTVTTIDINGGTIDGTTQASGTINGPIAAGGTWTAAATWTLPAHTLGGTVTSNGQSFSGTIANLGTVTTVDLNGGTIDGTVIGGASASAGTFTTLTSTGNTALGDAEASDTHAIKGATTLLANSASAALTVTQTGSGNAFVVEDSASTDSTPFVIDASGLVIAGDSQARTYSAGSSFKLQAVSINGVVPFVAAGYAANATSSTIEIAKSRSSDATHTVLQSGDGVGAIRFTGSDGTNFTQSAKIEAFVDGTPGTNDMPGRLVFSTTADGASTPTEAMRIDSSQQVGIGGAPSAGETVRIIKNLTGATTVYGIMNRGTVRPDVTGAATLFNTFPATASNGGTPYTVPQIIHYSANQGTINADSTVTSQFGFSANSSLTGATNNYGFYGNIASGTGRWNFYANGTAANYFAGDMQFDKTITAAATTGNQTINKNAGSVNFAAAATSLTVTNSRVTANSVIVATVATNDTTMKSVAAVPGSGSFVLYANAAATAETRVNFWIVN